VEANGSDDDAGQDDDDDKPDKTTTTTLDKTATTTPTTISPTDLNTGSRHLKGVTGFTEHQRALLAVFIESTYGYKPEFPIRSIHDISQKNIFWPFGLKISVHIAEFSQAKQTTPLMHFPRKIWDAKY